MSLKFSKSTDSEQEVKLDSAIISATWQAGFAYGGSEVGVLVKTAFVGEGTKINIKGKSEKGKNLGKLKDVIYGNSFFGKLTIPEKIEIGDRVFFEVELPQLGLSDESSYIPAGPPIKVSKMKWSQSEARRGDTLKLTAEVKGVRDGAEAKVTIFEHDADGNHDKIAELAATIIGEKLELDWEYEYHEDTDEIPTQAEMEKYGGKYNPPEYFFEIEINGHRFGENQESGLLKFKDWLEIEFLDEDGQPVANSKYAITFADGSTRTGTLDGSGRAKEENVPPGPLDVEFNTGLGLEPGTQDQTID